MSDPSPMPDPLEMLKKMWAPMGLPMPGMPGMVTPSFNVAEIDKRIADLKSVENWLSMNLNMLRMNIQGLEMQKATIAAMQQGMQAAQQAAPHMAQAASPSAFNAPGFNPSAANPTVAPPAAGNPLTDPAMWWNMLQPQAGEEPPQSAPKKK
ncbi:MAG: PhaM family polyhydroxyalkanoate granule multifunctional regulatory protein [Betaproteobacteria bacterium]